MRGVVAGLLGLTLVAAAGAQAPPAGARDITSMPETQAIPPAPAPGAAGMSTAESTAVAPPATVLRVYIDTLTGADTTAISGLLAQALYQSKQVVVTENQSNASVIVRGEVVRELPPAPESTSRKHATTRQKSAAAAAHTTPPANADTSAADVAPGMDLDEFGLSALPSSGASDPDVDLSHYRYRLNLELLDPAGDVVWMSGRGVQAQPFQAAQAAVAQTVQALLGALTPMAAANRATPY
ncbi:MAG TPA: hypothetical protein VNE83_01190 [Terriglobales bacterium]|nr:hypothetical protein [Terriglobales bacterium]